MRLPARAFAATTAVILAAATPALALGLSTSEAGQAAAQAAKSVAKQVHASSARVTGCKRLTSRKAVCRAEARFTSGARRCTFEVIVTQSSAKGQRPRATPANFVCY